MPATPQPPTDLDALLGALDAAVRALYLELAGDPRGAFEQELEQLERAASEDRQKRPVRRTNG